MGTSSWRRADVRRWVTAGGLAASLAAGCHCPPKPQTSEVPPPDQGGSTTAWQNDCQQDSVRIVVAMDSSHLSDTIVTAASMPLIGPIANLPEYHDCQRFVVPVRSTQAATVSGMRYGPLMAIWAAHHLDSLFQVAPAPGVAATPVAIVHNFEATASYELLGLQPGFSCLYLWNDGTWHARMVPLGRLPVPCLEPMDPRSRTLAAGKELHVRPVPLRTGMTASDVPPVARWDWDDKHGWQYIGIRCGKEWCEVGPPTFAPSQGAGSMGLSPSAIRSMVEPLPGLASAPAGTEPELLRFVLVNGWFDQQRLDLRDAGGQPVLTNVVGTVLPHPALQRLPVGAFKSKWIPTGYLHVTGDYPGKLPLKQGMNRMYMCQGTATECEITGAPTCTPEQQDPLDPWWARVVAPSGEAVIKCVRQRDHDGMAIPAAAARWNWHELDATTWFKCDRGCCTAN